MSEHETKEPDTDDESPSDVIYLWKGSDRLITQQRNGSIMFWTNVDDKYELVANVNNNYKGFCRCQFSEDLNLLVTPKNTSEISLIKCYGTYDESFAFKPPTDAAPCDTFKGVSCLKLVFHEDEIFVFAGYESGHLVLWDIEIKTPVHFIAYEFPISTFDYDVIDCRGFLGSPESVSILHSFGFDKERKILYKRDMEEIVYKPQNIEQLHGVSCVRIRPDRKLMMVGTYDGTVHVHSMKYLRILTTLRIHRQAITDIAYSEHEIKAMKSKITAIAGGDVISVWDIYYKWKD